MDPNATLELIEEQLASAKLARAQGDMAVWAAEIEDAREAREDLHEWLAKGGFEPEWTAYPAAAAFYSNRY